MRFVGLCVPRWSQSSPTRTGGQLSCGHALMRVVQGFARETRAYCAYHEHVSCIYRWMDVTLLGVSYHQTLSAFLLRIPLAQAAGSRRLGAHRAVERPRVPDGEPVHLRLLEGAHPDLILGGRQDAAQLGLDALLPPGIVGPELVPGPCRPAF